MRKEDFFGGAYANKNKIQIGDKVRFLNDVGGGRVNAFKGKDMVLVEDENGFEIPVLIAECVVVGESDRRLERNEPESYVVPEKKPEPKSEIIEPKKEYHFEETPQGERLNISLAFLPVDAKAFIQTAFETYFINESNYFLFVNYMSCKNNSWKSRYHGVIEPDTKIFIEEFEKSELTELEHICVQIVAFKERKNFSLKNPMSIELRIDTVKFYKMHCFTENDFFNEDALIVPLVVEDRIERQMLVSASELEEAMHSRKIIEDRRKPQPTAKKPKPKNEPLEVDLHINQLLDSTVGMDNAAILKYQLDKFHEVMKANLSKKGCKIVFIHGKGEGVLRAAIENELKSTYKKQSRFQDASFREYGFGATLVTIY